MREQLRDAEEERTKLLERAPVDWRVNRLKAERGPVLAQLPDGKPTRMSPDGIRLPEGWPVEQTALWKDGLVEVQDEGSQIIARLCEARSEEHTSELQSLMRISHAISSLKNKKPYTSKVQTTTAI